MVIQDGPGHNISWDTPEDQARFRAAAAFMDEAGIEGTITPLYTKYREQDGLDALILRVDGRNMTVHHVGTRHPEIGYGDDENDAWTFRMEAGDGVNKNEHEILADLVAGARHDAACQEAWRGSADTFEYGETAEINDFGVRYGEDGARIISLTASHGREYVELSSAARTTSSCSSATTRPCQRPRRPSNSTSSRRTSTRTTHRAPATPGSAT